MVGTISKSIQSLERDINELLTDDRKRTEGSVAHLIERFDRTLTERLTKKQEQTSGLRMSNYGTYCERKLWYAVNQANDAEPFLPHTKLKFMYGDIVEDLILWLASEAGHKVEGEQEELELEGVSGHRDAIIDGMIIDIKSANSRSFAKFKKPSYLLESDIWFATYRDQLQLYLESSKDDPRVTIKKVGGFLAFDQEMGHIKLQLVPKKERDWKTEIEAKKRMLEASEPPARAFIDEKDGESGNRKLCTYCSYCQFKKVCWPEVRTFISSQGPKHLTKVVRIPNMKEV